MHEKKFRQTLRRAFWIPFGVALLLGGFLILDVQFLMRQAAWVEHSDQVIALSQRLYRYRLEQESGVRAFVLTGDERFLEPYLQGRDEALATQSQLHALLGDNPEQGARNQAASQAFQAWTYWADQAVAMKRAGQAAADVPFQLRGKELMDEYRRTRSAFIEREQQLRDERLARTRQTLGFVNATIVVLVIVSDFGLAFFGRRQLTSLSHSYNDVLIMVRQQRARARLEQERVSGIIDSAMDAIITVDESQRIHVFNRAAEHMFLCPASEAIGQPLDRFIPQRFRDAHRQHIQGFGRTGVTTRSMSSPGELLARRSDDQEFPIEATISQVQAGGEKLFTVVLRDVTEKKKAVTRLAEQANLLELSSDAIIVRDDHDRIAYWNKGAEDLYGWARHDVLGEITYDLLQTEFPQPLPEIMDQVQQHHHWQGELVHTCKNGERVIVLSRWARVDRAWGGDSPQSLMEINTDITRRTQLETALQSNERLALAGRLSASIAHEIHNPLDAVGNILFLIRNQAEAMPEIKELVNAAQQQVHRVTEISRNMLNLNRESRSASPVNFAELLDGAVALVDNMVAKGSRDIRILPGFDGQVEASPSELRQVLTNLIKNAVEATADGGQIILSSASAREDGRSGVLLQIVDNGMGISEEIQSKLFSPFVSSKAEDGSGLGLWICHRIIEKHGGTIRIASRTGLDDHGTAVSIFLPVKGGVTVSNAGRPSA